MFNYLVTISYDGNYFYGWAKQPNLKTIQQSLEDNLSILFKEKILVTGSGRTDRYVHALNQKFNFISKNEIPFEAIKKFLNNKNKHWNIIDIKKVDLNFNARFNSKLKIYQYKFKLNYSENEKVFLENNFYLYKDQFLNLDLIKKNAQKMIGKKDFASFSAKENYLSTVRNLKEINFYLSEDELIVEFIGEGFLRYMVRNLMGSLIALNENKITESDFDDLFLNPKKGKNHYKLKGNALYLKDVIY